MPRSNRMRVVLNVCWSVCWIRNERDGTVFLVGFSSGVTKKASGRVRCPASRAWTVTDPGDIVGSTRGKDSSFSEVIKQLKPSSDGIWNGWGRWGRP